MRTLFIAQIDHVDPPKRDGAIDALSTALAEQFPAYWVSETVKADAHIAVVVESRHDTFPRPNHLDGWGHGWLTLSLPRIAGLVS